LWAGLWLWLGDGLDPAMDGNMATRRREFSPLMAACLEGDLKKVQRLLAKGVDVNEATVDPGEVHEFPAGAFTVNDGERTALMIAAGDMGAAYPEIVRYLLDAGAQVDVVSGSGYTALCHAAAANSVEVVELLLARGADPNPDAMFTPLYCAAQAGSLEAAKILLAHGAKVNGRIWTKETPVMTAPFIGGKAPALFKLLLRHKANVTLRDRDGRTALHHATDSNIDKTWWVSGLLNAGADPSAADRAGKTPLHVLAERSTERPAMVKLLIAAGAKVNVKDKARKTPLHYAREMEQRKTVRLLLAAGAN
jgi:ankyrin repeat protein